MKETTQVADTEQIYLLFFRPHQTVDPLPVAAFRSLEDAKKKGLEIMGGLSNTTHPRCFPTIVPVDFVEGSKDE